MVFILCARAPLLDFWGAVMLVKHIETVQTTYYVAETKGKSVTDHQ